MPIFLSGNNSDLNFIIFLLDTRRASAAFMLSFSYVSFFPRNFLSNLFFRLWSENALSYVMVHVNKFSANSLSVSTIHPRDI